MRALLTRLTGRMSSRRWLAVAVVAVVLGGGLAWSVWPEDPGYSTLDQRITVGSGPSDGDKVTLDTRLYLPAGASPENKVPALLLAHGFGGSKATVAGDAEGLARLGYAVLTWTARGFGTSTGKIHLNASDYEVADAQRLLDWLAQRPEIRTDAPDDPRVGVLGSSYGGALALLLAAVDQRVDAIVPAITWNDLSRSLLAQSADTGEDGVLKQTWAGVFFGAGSSPLAGLAGSGMAGGRGGAGVADVQCGRWDEQVCQAYLRLATTGRIDDQAKRLFDARSPATVLDRIKAPTLLVQGTADTLFPLAEADANARGIAANGTPVRVAWFTGGHDGGAGPASDQDRIDQLSAQWLDHYVKGEGQAPPTSFTFSRITGLDAVNRDTIATGYRMDEYPGMSGDQAVSLSITGTPKTIANPPNGTPAAMSSLPGAGGLSGLVNGVALELPGQHASWDSQPLGQTLSVAGSPTVDIRAASPTGEAVLFVKLYDVDPQGSATLSNGQIAPVRLTGLAKEIGQAAPVKITLPGIVREIEAGHRVRITIASADQAYLGPVDPIEYTVAPAGAVQLPTVAATPIATAARFWWYLLGALLAVLAVGLLTVIVVARRGHRRRDRTVVAEYADTPLRVRGLRKVYGDAQRGFVAVDSIDFTVERGQVVGLLGPNGAGKTTSLRVLMGLTQATAGEVLIFGHRLVPGTAVLSRIGALVEGPGFLPHLTGEQNLRAYWKATGRPMPDAHFAQALEIAGLGDAVKRKVKNYSHGMRQRLAVAQAMLGLPELLVLDEPTDGLDPPQIAEMRRVLQRYATDGRAVLVSSHLLAEVEQTCTHAVVVHKGRVVASGRVEEIVGDTPTTVFDVSDVDMAQKVLDRLDGVAGYALDGERTLIVDLGDVPRPEAVAALVRAGVGVDRVTARRRLEDAFLALVGSSTAGSGDR